MHTLVKSSVRNLLYLFKLNVSKACSKIVGIHYYKFLSLYNFCSREAKIVKNSKEAVSFNFSYKNRDLLYLWVNKEVIMNAQIDHLEFGVYQGESIKKWCSINKNPTSRFYGFDSFEGLPEKYDSCVVREHLAQMVSLQTLMTGELHL